MLQNTGSPVILIYLFNITKNYCVFNILWKGIHIINIKKDINDFNHNKILQHIGSVLQNT